MIKNIVKLKKRINFKFILCLILINQSILPQGLDDTQYDTHPMHWARFWARGVFNRNLIYSPVWNIGNITDSNISPGVPMKWPGSEGLSYGSYFNFYIGTLVTDMSQFEGQVVPEQWDGEQFPILSDAYLPHISQHSVAQLSSDRTHQQIWSPIPGFYNGGINGFIWGINEDINGDGELAPAEDLNFNGQLDYHLDPPESIIKSIAMSTDKRTWPEYWPGGTYPGDTRPYFNRPPRTTNAGLRAGLWNGEYGTKTIADQESYYMMDDHENDHWNDYKSEKYWPMKNDDGTPNITSWTDGGIQGAGLEIEARTYAWFHPLAEDLIVSVYKIHNYSDYELPRLIAGTYADANIGGQSEYNRADYIIAEYDHEGEGGRLEFDIMYQWYAFPEQLDTYQKIGVFGFGFLESPGVAYNGIDDDADGLIDESMSDGIDNDGDWFPFADVGLDRVGPNDSLYIAPDEDGSENNGQWDTEDINLNGALDLGEDINENDRLDYEPERNDVGSDGIGPSEYGWTGPDSDGTECNNVMDPGEPDFDQTDIDEQDQAGLKHIYVYEQNKDLKSDNLFWVRYLNQEGIDIEETDDNIAFTFGARNIKLEKDEWKRFTISMLMGEDNDDIVRNKSTMQKIYNNNYRFLTPPIRPTVISTAFDKKVILYWDTEAEFSKDPYFGYDFEGYRVYKSTNPKFLDIKTISDAFGNVILLKPLAIYDKSDGLKGPHPVPFPALGVHYDMGKDSGLKHSYIDTLVDNGRLYYYAITSIDAGNDYDFYDRGLVTEYYPLQAMPSESPFNITVNPLGEVVYRDRNTAVVVPVETSAGYTDPNVDTSRVEHVSGYARGVINNIQVFNRHNVKLGNEYEITFSDNGWLEEVYSPYEFGTINGMMCMNLTTGDTLFDFYEDDYRTFLSSSLPVLERLNYQGLHFDFSWPLPSSWNDKTRGIDIITWNNRGRTTHEWKKWSTETNSNLRVDRIELPVNYIPLPYDFEIRVENEMGVDTSISPYPPLIPIYPLNFTTWNVTDPNNPEQMKVQFHYDVHHSTLENNPDIIGQLWDSTRVIITIPPKDSTSSYKLSWSLRFLKNPFDSLNSVIPPSPGDVYKFRTTRNPSRDDVYRFTVEGGEWIKEQAKKEMKNIYVVPDPYVVASSFESIYDLGGRSARKIEFVNLPPQCEISIFTASGKLVKKISHNSIEEYGRHDWNLTSEDGPEVSFGMYFFVVEAKGVGIKRGKFAVIK
ncbi:MAG: hypothetical protein HN674_02500 [Candidatus Marinimicrobia bacterium]|nr:hypothetical protein [Candidatus Neomarinimicrobiota bacterium]MBT3501149.1 hypothetical protein [Candidatus Neomarinimicrobiota bacterium]MBT3840449.1 hypothetical protein [Candidatus Neomarinimicrobiota bacterium]MBT4000015.1 hypothetical protein [Candidatus Neomarinimicrobiota bacterium]MBT4282386.1 hypothetical protein [Candidatus Neomarinimicrobiota bacterium]